MKMGAGFLQLHPVSINTRKFRDIANLSHNSIRWEANSRLISCSRTQSCTPLGASSSTHQILNKVPSISEEITQQSSTFDFTTYMHEKMGIINAALDKAVPLREPIKIHQTIRYSLLSDGKRWFPLLCLACCELVGGNDMTALPAACSLEMIVLAHIILDDLPCMDNDDIRRGQPSNHKVFGEHMSIMAASALTVQAFEHIVSQTVGVSSETVIRVISEMSRLFGCHQGIIVGQVADKEYEGRSDVGLEELEYVHLSKAATVVEACSVLGGILGGATDEEIERLRKFARYGGLLLQAVDDVVDVTKSTQELGKTAGKDLVAHKLTYPKIFGIERSRKIVEELCKNAISQLAGFDPEKTAPAVGLIHSLANRIY